VVPVQAEQPSLDAIDELNHVVAQVNTVLNPNLSSLLLVTMFVKNTNHCQEVLAEARRLYNNVFDAVIPNTIKFPDSVSARTPIIYFDPAGIGAESYRQAAKELINEKSIR
jgi:chromosome partitioning protein